MNDSGILSGLRVGFGFHARRFVKGQPLWIGGSEIAYSHGLGSGIEGDIVCRAVGEALLSAAGLPGAGVLFEDDPAELNTGEPLVMLSQVSLALQRKHVSQLLNISIQLAAKGPDLASYRKSIIMQLASALQVEPGQVALTITTDSDLELVEALEEVEAGRSAVAFANLLCVARSAEEQKSKRGTARTVQQELPVSGGEENETDRDDSHLPARAREFEDAVSTKLPPLPPAPRPKEGEALIIYTDGASRGNPGPSATGWVVFDMQGRLVHESGSTIGEHTNNQAEYLAVHEAAQWVEQNLGRSHALHFRLDSELVAKQLSGDWKIKDAGLKQLAMEALNLLMYFDSFDLTHVPRKENVRADALANKALDDAKRK